MGYRGLSPVVSYEWENRDILTHPIILSDVQGNSRGMLLTELNYSEIEFRCHP